LQDAKLFPEACYGNSTQRKKVSRFEVIDLNEDGEKERFYYMECLSSEQWNISA